MSMRTTIDIPDDVLKHTMAISGATTKRGAIIAAMEDFNRRHRLAGLTALLGTGREMITTEELVSQRNEHSERRP